MDKRGGEVSSNARTHGLRSTYTGGKCRCEACRRSNREYQQLVTARRRTITNEHGLPEHVAHGHSAYVNWGCRCEVCTKAASRRRWSEKKRAEKKAQP